jgi:hypothetical protein
MVGQEVTLGRCRNRVERTTGTGPAPALPPLLNSSLALTSRLQASGLVREIAIGQPAIEPAHHRPEPAALLDGQRHPAAAGCDAPGEDSRDRAIAERDGYLGVDAVSGLRMDACYYYPARACFAAFSYVSGISPWGVATTPG